LVLGENGTAFASGLTAASDGSSNDVDQIASFDLNSGTPNWTYQAPVSNKLSIISVTAGNGLVARNTNGSDTVVRFSAAGNAVSDAWSGTQIDYYIADLWTGAAPGSGMIGYSAASIQFSDSAWILPNQQGSSQAKQAIHVTAFSNSGPNQIAIQNVLQKIVAALPSHSTCSNWLQGGGISAGTSGSAYIQTMLDLNAFGHGVFNKLTVAAFTGAVSDTGVPVGTSMTVNDNSAFFLAKDGNGNSFTTGARHYPGGTLRAQAAILIHETAHGVTVTGFQSDGTQAGKANDELVDKNCRDLIEGLQ
jgi:hypothetical protein